MTSMRNIWAILLFPLVSVTAHAQPLSSAQSFGYLLQNISVSDLQSSEFDIIVMDYSRDGTSSEAFSREEINSISSGRSGRVVLSYLSIGEAEDYRFYFKRAWIRSSRRGTCRVALSPSAPQWLDKPNKNWCGNYKTRYWDRNWKRLIYGVSKGRNKSYLDRIIDAGFQGVYLDIIDGYEYWLTYSPKSQRRKSAAQDMARFVIGISKYARETRGVGNFVIVPQNGSSILQKLSPSLRQRYLNAIDGIGAEDTFYFGTKDEDNDLDPQEEVLDNLQDFIEAGKRILAIDYLSDPLKIGDFVSRSCARGFIPQVATRKLDSLNAESITGCP